MAKRKLVKKKIKSSKFGTKLLNWLGIFACSIILIFAFWFRINVLNFLKSGADSYFYSPQPGTDMLTYHLQAKGILEGSFPKGPFYYNPFYAYFLAACYKIFGEDLYIVRLIQIILGIITYLLIYLIGKMVFNKIIGLIATAAASIYGVFILYETTLLIETLSCFLIILSLYLLLLGEKKRASFIFFLAGITEGFSGITRANVLAFIPAVGLWLYAKEKLLGIKHFFLFLLGTIIILSPVTYHNWKSSGGKFILVSTNGPIIFWIGNNPYSKGDFTYPPAHHSQKIEKLKEKYGDKAYFIDAYRFMMAEPVKFLCLQLRKLHLFWDSWEIPNNVTYDHFVPVFKAVGIPFVLSFGTVGAISICGLFRAIFLWRKLSLLYIFFLVYMITIVGMHVLSRYRIQITPILLLFASYFIFCLFKDIKNKNILKVGLSTLAIIFSLVLVNFNFLFAKVYPALFKESLVHKDNNILIVRDNNGEYHGEQMVILDEVGEAIRKEFYVPERILKNKIKELTMSVKFAASGENPGLLAFFNGKFIGICNLVGTGALMQNFSGRIPKKLLKKGKNVIELVTLPNTYVVIPKDNLYHFGRSHYRKDQNSPWETQKGEFMIDLVIKVV